MRDDEIFVDTFFVEGNQSYQKDLYKNDATLLDS